MLHVIMLDKKLKHIESMKIAVEQYDIQHSSREEFAEYLVQKARTEE